jgi:NAD dependent epimerase/dehydratase
MPFALVTGAGGFIGSHLVEFLTRHGWRVRAMVRYTSSGYVGLIQETPAEVKAELEIVRGDLRDPDFVQESVRGVDIVFNLAALIGIPYSYEAPESYFQTNTLGTLNVLRAVQRWQTARLVQTSTSEIYGSAQFVPIDEKHPIHPQSPYAASKVASDQLSLSFHRSFGTPVVVLRPFNTYGPRQSARAVIPTIVSQAVFGERVRLGSLAPVRDFLYVLDTCAAFLAAAETPGIEGEELNCATGCGVSIGELAERVFSVVGRRVPVEFDSSRVRPDASEVDRLIGSHDKLMTLTGWRPSVDLDEGLAKVNDWVSAHAEKFDVPRYAK